MVCDSFNFELNKEIEYLYNRCWDEELSEDDQYNLEDYAEKVTKKYGWDKVYHAACNYLHELPGPRIGNKFCTSLLDIRVA